MSYSMTHLIIARKYSEAVKIDDLNLFFLGSIAPDAVHSREDFSFDIKGYAHMLQKDRKWGRIYEKEDIDTWYYRLKEFYTNASKLAKNSKEQAFLDGYTLHCLTDIFNCSDFYGPLLIRYNCDADSMRVKYREECILQDNYLYQNYEYTDQLMKALDQALAEEINDGMLADLDLLQYISCKNISDNCKFMNGLYSEAKKASLEGLEMITEESTWRVINDVSLGCIRMLKEFPEAEDTFVVKIF